MKPFDPRLLPHLRPAAPALSVALVAGALEGLATVGQAFALGSLVVSLVGDPAGHGWHGPAGWLAVAVVVRAACGLAIGEATSRAAGQVGVTVRQRLLDAALSSGKPPRIGELTLLATRGVAALEPYLTRYLPSLVLAVVLPPATLLAIGWLDWPSGLIVLCTLPLVPVFAILIGTATRDRADRQWRSLAALSGHFVDVVRGLPTLVLHRRAEAQAGRIRAITERYRRATLQTLRLAFASSVALELVATLSVALVAVCVGLRLATGSLDFRIALIVLLLAPEAYWPWRRVGAEFHAAAEGTASFEAIDEMLAALRDQGAAGHAVPSAGVRTLTLDGLSLGYGDRVVVADLHAQIAGPALVAITGPSGCGKSTLLQALLGELTPLSGEIRVGATPAADLDPDAWHRSVAWAPQRPWLTSGSIASNLRLGCPEATDAQLWQALATVGLDYTVAALPDGLESPLGEDGAGLSAGERARIGLARVVLADRPFVLLDEPTAHLDAATESIWLDTMRRLAERATVVVVAHRAAVVAAADQVLTLPAPGTAPRPRAGTIPTSTPEPAPTTAPLRRTETDRTGTPRQRFGLRAGIVLGTLSAASGVALTATAAWLITRAAAHPPVLVLMVAIVAVRTFGLARPVLRYAERLVSHDAALRMLARHRAEVYDVLVPLTPGRLGRRRGDLLSSVVDDVDSLVDDRLRVHQPLWTGVLVGVLASGLAAWADPLAGAIVAAVTVAAGLGAVLARWGARSAESGFVDHRAGLSAQVEELLHGAREHVLWGAAPAALAALLVRGRSLAGAATRSARGVAAGRALVVLGSGAGMLAMAAAPLAVDDAVRALLVLLPLALVDAILPMVDAGALSVRTRAARSRLAALDALAPAVSDPSQPLAAPATHPAVTAHDVSGGWDDRVVLRGIGLDLPPGRRLGVVGPSGCGKSTLAALLLRSIDPATGAIRLDGADLRALRLDDVRRRVGLVDDDPYVFASSIVENVRLARPSATDTEVAAVLRRARLGEWLDVLPLGIHTLVGEGHAQVSGGERARLGLARALLADQPVLVLDEPTAHLDTATAQALADDLLTGGREQTLVWITHGTAGLDQMDDVLHLEPDGQARQTGPPVRAERPIRTSPGRSR